MCTYLRTFFCFDKRQSSALSAKRSKSGLIFSLALRFAASRQLMPNYLNDLQILFASATLKNVGATSCNHFGSMTVS